MLYVEFLEEIGVSVKFPHDSKLSLFCRLAKLMKEIGSQLVFSCLELLFRASGLVENGDVQAELLTLKHVSIKEVNDL